MRTSCVSAWTAPRPWARGRQGLKWQPDPALHDQATWVWSRIEACDVPGQLRCESPCDATEPGL
jgi:hypothetical protein